MTRNVDDIVASLEAAYASGKVPRAEDFRTLRYSGEHYVRALKIAYRYGLVPNIGMTMSARYWAQIAVNDAFQAGMDIESVRENFTSVPVYIMAAAYANGAAPDPERDFMHHPQSYDCPVRAFLAVSYGAKITYEQAVIIGSLEVLIAAYEKGALAPSEDHVDFMVNSGAPCVDAGGVSDDYDFFDPICEEGRRTLVGEAFVAAYKAGLPATPDHLARVRLQKARNSALASPALAREHVRARILEGAYRYGGLTPDPSHVSGRATKRVYVRAALRAARRATVRRLVSRVTNDDIAEIVVCNAFAPDDSLGPKTILDVRLFTPAGLQELRFPETAYIRNDSHVDEVINQRMMCRIAGADMSFAFDEEAIDRAFKENVVPLRLRQFSMDRCWSVSKTIHNRKLVRYSIKRLRATNPGAVATVVAESKGERTLGLGEFVRACVLQETGLPWRMVLSISGKISTDEPAWLDEYRRLYDVSRHVGMDWLPYDWNEVCDVANTRLRTPEMKKIGIAGMESCDSIEKYERGKAKIARCARAIEEHRGNKALAAATHVFSSSWFGHAPPEALFGRLEIAKNIVEISPDIPDHCLREWCGHTGAVEFVKHAAAIGARLNASVEAVMRSFKFKPSRLAITARFLDGTSCLKDLDPRTLSREVRHGVTACLRAANPGKDVNMTADRYVVFTRERPQACPIPESAEPVPEVDLDERVPRMLRHNAIGARLYRYLRVSLPGVMYAMIRGMARRGEGLDLVAAIDGLPVQDVRDEFVLNLFVRSLMGRVNANAKWTYRQPNVIDDVLELKRLLDTGDPVRALGSCPTVAQVNGLACYLAAKGSRLVSSTYNVWDGRFVDADFSAAAA